MIGRHLGYALPSSQAVRSEAAALRGASAAAKIAVALD